MPDGRTGLDPQLAAALESIPASIDPGVQLRELEVIRMLRSTLAILEVTGGKLPEDERVSVENRTIQLADGRPSLLVRIYRPVYRGGEPAPGLVFLHGGAFVLGDVYSEELRCLSYCSRAGCVVVSVEYRLAPEDPFPAGLDDAVAALQWVSSHSDELGADPKRLGVAGSSAGGALAAATALVARDRGGPSLAFQLLVYPVIDDRMQTPSMRAFDRTPLWTNGASADMWEHYLGETSARGDVSEYAAPGRARDLSGLPPAYVMTAEFDPLRDEGIDYARRLLEAGVPTELHSLPGTFHGFDIVAPGAALSVYALSEQIRAISRALASNPA